MWYGRDGWHLNKIMAHVLWLCSLSGLALLLPLPALWRGWRLSSHSPRHRLDWLTFAALNWVESAANIYGLLKGLRELQRAGVN